MDRILCYMYIFFGGGIGCTIRFFLDHDMHNPFTPSNVSACLLMGISYALFNYRVWLHNKFAHAFVNIGLLGGFSTFTPLALYSIATTQDSLLLAIPLLALVLLAYLGISIVSYFVTATLLQKIWHKERQLSQLARDRLVFYYRPLAERFKTIQANYSKLKSTEKNLYNEKELTSEELILREQLKLQTEEQLKELLAITELYNQAVLKDGCAQRSLEQMLAEINLISEAPTATPSQANAVATATTNTTATTGTTATAKATTKAKSASNTATISSTATKTSTDTATEITGSLKSQINFLQQVIMALNPKIAAARTGSRGRASSKRR